RRPAPPGVPGYRYRTFLHSLLQARRDEVVEIAVEYRLRIAGLVIGPQILDPRLVDHIGPDLVAPADVGLRVFQLLLRLLPLAQLELVQLPFEDRHRFGAIAVLRAVVLALDDDVGPQVRDSHGGIRVVDVP